MATKQNQQIKLCPHVKFGFIVTLVIFVFYTLCIDLTNNVFLLIPFLPFRTDFTILRIIYIPLIILLPASMLAAPASLFLLFKHTINLKINSKMMYLFLLSASLLAISPFLLGIELIGEETQIKLILILLYVTLFIAFGMRYYSLNKINNKIQPAIYRLAILYSFSLYVLYLCLAISFST